MLKIEFNTAFRTDKAGRTANQDNGFCITNIADSHGTDNQNINTDRTIKLGNLGALFVVADGMGGMNAGEKASELVVQSMQRTFASVPANIAGDSQQMSQYLVKAIAEADKNVKTFAKANSQTRGMGSTIVALWICNDTAVAARVGDSRIYRYNPANGLVRLSHDHSYVQGLVDAGRLPEHMAFDHPDSNIITRSLGDNNEPANPETRTYKVYDSDEFLLCSDGLCGLLTDTEIEHLMAAQQGSSLGTLNDLWQEGERKGWTDNATIEVICVAGELPAPIKDKPEGYSAPEPRKPKPISTLSKQPAIDNNTKPIPTPISQPKLVASNRHTNGWIYIIAAIILICGGITAFYFISGSHKDETPVSNYDTGINNNLEMLNNQEQDIRKLIEPYKGNVHEMPMSLKEELVKMARRLAEDSKKMRDAKATAADNAPLTELQLQRIEYIYNFANDILNKIAAPTPSDSSLPQPSTSRIGTNPTNDRQASQAQPSIPTPTPIAEPVNQENDQNKQDPKEPRKPKEPKKTDIPNPAPNPSKPHIPTESSSHNRTI